MWSLSHFSNDYHVSSYRSPAIVCGGTRCLHFEHDTKDKLPDKRHGFNIASIVKRGNRQLIPANHLVHIGVSSGTRDSQNTSSDTLTGRRLSKTFPLYEPITASCRRLLSVDTDHV